MGNADSVSAAFGLLLGLAVQHHAPAVAATRPTVMVAQVQSGPAIAIDKAKAAAAAESQRAHDSDAQAERIFANGDSGTPATGAAAPAKAASDGTSPSGIVDGKAVVAANSASAASGDGRYDPSRHRDPFRPPNLTPAAADKAAVARTPLETYELGQLKLVGIVKDAGTTRAMVEDSAGLGYIVTTGTAIGSGGGVVRAIEQRRMLIQEMTTNFYGEKQAKEVVMELPQEDRSP